MIIGLIKDTLFHMGEKTELPKAVVVFKKEAK